MNNFLLSEMCHISGIGNRYFDSSGCCLLTKSDLEKMELDIHVANEYRKSLPITCRYCHRKIFSSEEFRKYIKTIKYPQEHHYPDGTIKGFILEYQCPKCESI